jgi:thymidylate synthase (FAD)
MERLAAAGKTRGTEEDLIAVQDPTWIGLSRSRERDECREKLISLGILTN